MSELYKDLPHTAFPNSVDTMTSFKNIDAEDISSVNMFQYYLRMGDFAAAESILDSIPDVANKMIDSNKLNKLRDALIALERYYKSDIKTYITDTIDVYSEEPIYVIELDKFNEVFDKVDLLIPSI